MSTKPDDESLINVINITEKLIKCLNLFQRGFSCSKRFLLIQKLYYDAIKDFFLLSEIKIYKGIPRELVTKKIDEIIPGLKNLTDFVFSQPNNHELIDFFTFSILPSYFKFFISNCSISFLTDFFFLIRNDPKYSDDQYDLLARIIFLSNRFVNFTSISLQPVFARFIDNDAKNGIDPNYLSKLTDPNEVDELFSNIIKFNYFFPKEAFVVLSLSSNPSRTLQNSFFKYALSSRNFSYIYNLFNIALNPSESLISTLQSSMNAFSDFFISELIENNPNLVDLKKDITDMINNFKINNPESINELISRVNDTSFCKFPKTIFINDKYEPNLIKNTFFSPGGIYGEEPIEFMPKYSYPVLISLNDLFLFNFFNHKISSFDSRATNHQNFFFDYNGTLSNYKRCKFHIDKNLKKVIKAQSFDYFLKEVTKRSNPTSLQDLFRAIFDLFDSKTKEKVRPYMEQLLKMPANYLHNLIISTFHLLDSIPIIWPNIDPIIFQDIRSDRLNDIIEYIHIEKIKIKVLPLKRYVSHPSLFHELINDIQSANQLINRYSNVSTIKVVNDIGLNFRSFIREKEKLNINLSYYDHQLNKFYSDQNNYFYEINSNFGIQRYSYIRSFISKFQHNYFNTRNSDIQIEPFFKNVSDMIIDAFLDNSFINKIQAFSFIQNMILDELMRNYNNSQFNIGSDEVCPLMSIILMIINPPKLISNFILISDFRSENTVIHLLIYCYNVISKLNNEEILSLLSNTFQ